MSTRMAVSVSARGAATTALSWMRGRPSRLGLAASIAIVVALSVAAFLVEHQREAARESELADQSASSIELIFAGVESDLIAAQVAIPSLGGVARPDFDAYAEELVGRGAVDAVAYHSLVDREGRERWEERAGTTVVDVSATGAWATAPARSRYGPVEHLYPADGSPATVVGFDVLADRAQRGAVLESVEVGRPRASTPVTLPNSDRIGVFVFQPLKAGGSASRQTPGVVSAFVGGDRIGQLLSDVVSDDAETSVSIGGAVLFGDGQPNGEVRAVEALGQTLRVTVAGQSTVAPLALAVGVLLGGLLAVAAGAIVLRSRHREAVRLVERRANAGNLRVVAERLSAAATSQEVIDAVGAYLERRLQQKCPMRLTVTEQGHPVFELTPTDGEAIPRVPAHDEIRAALPDHGAMRLEVWFPPGLDQRVPIDSVNAVASMAGVALQRSLDFDRQRQALDALQRTLLPHALPGIPGASVDARYIASASKAIGGDWYDAIHLADGTVVLVIGDVVGRGMEAAITMGQLRVAGDIASLDPESSPADVLGLLNEYCLRRTGTYTATCLVVCMRPDGSASAASAGHIDPLILGSDGVRVWPIVTGPALGLLPEARYPISEVQIPVGGGILLLTDGMVERRDESVDVSLERAAAQAAGIDPKVLLDVLPETLDVARDDDAAMLLYLREPERV